ncbi:hypothetical protein R1sor_013569 [Riccia sorocarpa]|uniref:Thiolase N-terminal domain-containing protein n=1 Tax=Riccia sorocarpa TaxID=122646 RepID=A0ABD3HAI7_9MARC
MGHREVVDGMIKDGVSDVYSDKGSSISREQQDDNSIQSYESHCGNQCQRLPVGDGSRGGSWRQRKANCYRAKADGVDILDAAKLRKLRPAFKEGGTVTAGNASSNSDGAAALVLVSGKYALEKGLTVIAKVRGYADAEQAPELFTTSPALAIPKAVKRAGIDASQEYAMVEEAHPPWLWT